MTFTIAFTGHRPNKFGGFNEPNPVRDALKASLRETLTYYKTEHPDLLCISGMALGFDQWAAEICIELSIPFTAAVPFAGQESKWPASSQGPYRALCSRAFNVHIVCEGGYAPWKMQRRNEWMIDHADLVIAAWNGTPGGTENAVDYAHSKKKPVYNLLAPPVLVATGRTSYTDALPSQPPRSGWKRQS